MKLKIKIAVMCHPAFTHSGVWWYRLHLPYFHLAKWFPEEFEVWMIDQPYDIAGIPTDYWDIFVFHPAGLPPGFGTFLQALQHSPALARKNRIIVDVDDAYDLIPEWNPAYSVLGLGNPDNLEFVEMLLHRADLITTTTETLKEHYQHLNPYIRVCPNSIAFSEYEERNLRKLNNHKKPVVYWGGSASHTRDLIAILPLPEAFQGRAIFILTMINPSDFKVPEGWHHVFWGAKAEDYVEFLFALDADIGLAPLEDIEFNQMKSNIKLLEYAVSGAGIICSPVGPYANFPDEACLKVKELTSEMWATAIGYLLDNPEEREKMCQRAYEFSRDNFDLRQTIKSWKDAIYEVFERPKILIESR